MLCSRAASHGRSSETCSCCMATCHMLQLTPTDDPAGEQACSLGKLQPAVCHAVGVSLWSDALDAAHAHDGCTSLQSLNNLKFSFCRWLEDHGTSPLTNESLRSKELIRNHALRSAIMDLQRGR